MSASPVVLVLDVSMTAHVSSASRSGNADVVGDGDGVCVSVLPDGVAVDVEECVDCGETAAARATAAAAASARARRAIA